jgi:CubicO group peptidase (beta-lactamase class C family)
VPEVSSSVYGGCSVRHLLDMSVGISFTEDYVDPDGDVARYRRAVGWDVIQPGQSAMQLREFLATEARRKGAWPHLPLCLNQHRHARLGL